MKINVEFTENQSLILQIIYTVAKNYRVETDGKIDFDALERLIEAINSKELDFDGSLRLIAAIKPLSIDTFLGNSKKSATELDVEKLIDLKLVKTNFLPGKYVGTGKNSLYDFSISLTEEGLSVAKGLHGERRVIIQPRKSLRDSIFIACAFGREDVDELYKKYFVPVCKAHGYKSIRIDMSEPDQSITELMMEEITKAACMITDLTYARPSVYFEAGYAQGLGIPIIFTCRKDHLSGHEDGKRVHFDLAQYKISFWSQNNKGTFEWAGKSMTPKYRLNSILKPRK